MQSDTGRTQECLSYELVTSFEAQICVSMFCRCEKYSPPHPQILEETKYIFKVFTWSLPDFHVSQILKLSILQALVQECIHFTVVWPYVLTFSLISLNIPQTG